MLLDDPEVFPQPLHSDCALLTGQQGVEAGTAPGKWRRRIGLQAGKTPQTITQCAASSRLVDAGSWPPALQVQAWKGCHAGSDQKSFGGRGRE